MTVRTAPIPGLEHLPYAVVTLERVDDRVLGDAFASARAIGKSRLEAWTTTGTPEVAAFLIERGFQEKRRYVVSELDIAAASRPEAPRFPLVTLAERPELAPALQELAQVAYPDQPGRAGTRIGEDWFEWGLHRHPPESYFVALEDRRVLGYGYLEQDGEEWWHGFMAVAREARGRGIAGAIKRAEIRFARDHGIAALRTATEVRLEGMMALNRRLGYRPLHEEIVLRSGSRDCEEPPGKA